MTITTSTYSLGTTIRLVAAAIEFADQQEQVADGTVPLAIADRVGYESEAAAIENKKRSAVTRSLESMSS